MAKNVKRVSINTIDKLAKENFSNTVTAQWYDTEVTIMRSISLKDTLEFVADVVSSCFDKSGNYIPEVVDFAIKSNVVLRYTNLSMPDNLNHRHSIIYDTDMMDFIYSNINMQQFVEIETAIHSKLKYLCDTNTKALEKGLRDLVNAFETTQKQMEGMFSGVSQEDIANVVGALANGGISEDKIVEAYISNMRNTASVASASDSDGDKA